MGFQSLKYALDNEKNTCPILKSSKINWLGGILFIFQGGSDIADALAKSGVSKQVDSVVLYE